MCDWRATRSTALFAPMVGEGGSPLGGARRTGLSDARERAATASSASPDDGRGRAASSATERVEVLASGLGSMLFEPAFSLEERELPPPDEIVAKQRPAIISTTPAAQLKHVVYIGEGDASLARATCPTLYETSAPPISLSI